MKLTAKSVIKTDIETLWRYTQDPAMHVRWDLRFTDISPYVESDKAKVSPKRFRYATRIGFGITIEGWGETIGDGSTSALKFGSNDFRSLIKDGSGAWMYKQVDGAVIFSTIYDYETRYGVFGKIVDTVLFRPIMIFATRLSFDRLREWIEIGTPPEASFLMWLSKIIARTMLAIIFIYEGLVPKILFVRKSEIDLVLHSGLSFTDAKLTLNALGLSEFVFGLLLISGLFERVTAPLTGCAILFLGAIVAFNRPEVLSDPFGGLSKNFALLACVTIWWLLSKKCISARQGEEIT